jgi:MerR family redox-sensitive transcriptional activator SoxR
VSELRISEEAAGRELRIGEVARASGLRASAIRYYEECGLVRPVGRHGNTRVYSADILDRLAVIELAKRAGFSLREIRKLLGGFARRAGPGKRWRALAEAKRPELDRRIEEARRMLALLATLVACACPTLEDCGRALRDAE